LFTCADPALFCVCVCIVLQLVVKILRNAYMPLPLSCSRPLQQLVGMLLRADPDDRPTTADLLATSLVRKHLQLLLGLAQGVHRGPAAAAAAAAGPNTEIASTAGGSRSGTPEAGRLLTSSQMQAAVDSRAAPSALQQLEQQQEDDLSAEEVQLGGGLSLALRDMMIAVKRMAKVPLHAGGSSSSSPPRRRRAAVVAAAAAAAPVAGDSSTGLASDLGFDGASGEQPDGSSPACGERQPGSSRGSTRARTDSDKLNTAAGSSSSSSDAVDIEAASGRSGSVSSGAAAYGALPTPVAVPTTKRPSLHAWDASAAYEVQQKKRAEARYQARIMEQRMAREQVCSFGQH
jgi:hypothetical protein